ncbi:hypothetical protein Tco_1160115 [Tanacetum coccineum]
MEMEHDMSILDWLIQTERSLPKPYNQYLPLGSSLKEKVQRKSLTWTTSTTLDVKFLIKNEEEIFTDAGDGVRIYPDGVASPAMLYLTRRSLEDLRMFSLDDSWRTI